MKTSALNRFVAFTARFEGVAPFMYLDVLGLVTTGIGDLIDPSGAAMSLPWVRLLDGQPATKREIAAEWLTVKMRTDLKMQGGMAFQSVTRLRLTPAGIDGLVHAKVAANEAELCRRFPDFEDWPADAQLATHSMAWACGPDFRFPKLADALLRQDFRTAAVECPINASGNPGVLPRNEANEVLYRNAANVLGMHLDPDALYYPTDLDRAVAQDDVTTQPEVTNPASDPTIHVVPNTLDAYTHLRDNDDE